MWGNGDGRNFLVLGRKPKNEEGDEYKEAHSDIGICVLFGKLLGLNG